MSTGGKGDKRRPTLVPTKVADNNWDRIFGKKQPLDIYEYELQQAQKSIDDEALNVYNEERLVTKHDKIGRAHV